MRRLALALLMFTLVAAGLNKAAPAARAAAAVPQVVVVTKQYGAALRRQPSSEATIVYLAACGETLSVAGSQDGWYRVYSRASYLWVGAGRVADADSPPSYDCSNAVTFEPAQVVFASVPTGCLSLRETPSRDASYSACVDSGTPFQLENGPIEVAGEDWFQVSSPVFGQGWMLDEFLAGTPLA